SGARPSSGAGYHVSSTWPASVTVASPYPQAERDSVMRPGYVTGCVRPVGKRWPAVSFPGSSVGSFSVPPTLDLTSDVVDLTRALCDIESVSGDEGPLADAVEAALSELDGLEVIRDGNVVVARTALGRAERVVLAGHLDTV